MSETNVIEGPELACVEGRVGDFAGRRASPTRPMAPTASQCVGAAIGTAFALLMVSWRLRRLRSTTFKFRLRRVGLIGGLAPASTIDYYKAINAGVRNALQGRHSAEVVIFSFDQDPVIEDEFAHRWDAVGEHLARAGCALQAAGCECLLVCCNSVHHETAYAALRRAVRIATAPRDS